MAVHRRLFRAGLAFVPGLIAGFAHAADPHFDCVDAFELISLATTFQCAVPPPAASGDALLVAARDKLVDRGFHTIEDFAGIEVGWCDLTNALGFTRGAGEILIDAGLKAGTVDLVAEVLAHEMVHARQFRDLGANGFRCAYVDAFVQCGGCQDTGHALEAPAYGIQTLVRERFHAEWLRAE